MRLSLRLKIGKYETVIDLKDYPRIKNRQLKIIWLGKKHTPYVALGGLYKGKRSWGNKQKQVLLHRFLVRAQPFELIDHVDRDPFNNRQRNLRRCNRQQNGANVGLSRANTTGYKGVSFKYPGKWSARIKVNYRKYHIGYFDSPEKAALAYNQIAQKVFGVFAGLNKIKL